MADKRSWRPAGSRWRLRQDRRSQPTMATHTLPLQAPVQGAPQTLIPRIDTTPRVVAFAQTTAGKIAMLACAAVLFYVRGVRDPVVIVVLAGIFFLPRHTWSLMAISGIYWIPSMVKGGFGVNQRITGTVLAVAIGALLWMVVQRWPKSWVGRSPRLTLLGVFGVTVAAALVAPVGPGSNVVWPLVQALSACLWIFSFGLTDRAVPDRALTDRAPSDGALLDRTDTALSQKTWSPRSLWANAAMFFSFFPTVFASTTPFFKRPSAMRRMEAKNPEERAVVQLRGLKLLAWSILLSLVWAILDTASAAIGIPKLTDAIAASTAHHPPAWYLCWASLLDNFFDSALRLAVWGNTIVAGCRLAGFRLLRNSYRPLQARTVVDFWNRYYYYFKELVADFFFYPVYMRCFKKHPRVRMLFATWVAVGLGVPLFHFVRDIDVVRELGVWRAVTGYHVFMVYATILGIGIGISQIRKVNAPRNLQGSFLRTRVLPIAGVILFFCVVSVFDELPPTAPIREHLLFLTRLAGWSV
jgi:D-alanyl-lipoteichoic acid acyltransferase DltB (MBOAT superfamily)